MAEADPEPDTGDNPGVVMLPPYIFLIALVLAIGLEFLVPIAFLPPPGPLSVLTLLGIVLIAAGLLLAIWGNRTFVAAGTNVPPSRPALQLVTHGPYRFTRNPMYVGMLLVLAGLTVGFSLEWGLAVWIGFALALHFGVILREERYLTRKFGDDYTRFAARTRRYV